MKEIEELRWYMCPEWSVNRGCVVEVLGGNESEKAGKVHGIWRYWQTMKAAEKLEGLLHDDVSEESTKELNNVSAEMEETKVK